MQKAFKSGLIAASVATAMLSLMSQQAYATNGYAAHGFGSVQKAMGGTAVAGSDNAMNIATNPAAMSFGKNNWTAGIDIFVPDRGTSYKGTPAAPGIPAGAPLGGGLSLANPLPATPALPGADLRGNDDSNFVVPEFAYQRHLNNKFAVGIAVYGNGGMNATYDRSIFGPRFNQNGSPINPDFSPAGSDTGIDFAQLFIAPAVSMKLGEKNSIGASLNLAYQRIKINGVGGFAAFSSDPANLTNNGYDDSTGYGITVGWQTKLTDALTAGLAYRSETKMSKFDKYSGLLAEQGDFDIPSMVTGGISYKATPKTTVALDIAHINYTDVKSISNKNNTAPLLGQLLGGVPPQNFQGPKLGDDEGAGFGWEDTTAFKFGVKHQLNNKMALMAGYNHGKAPIGSDQTAFNILAPATVEDHLTLGLDWKLSPSSKVVVSYMHAFSNEIKGDGSRAPTGAFNSPGAIINNGPNPLTNATAADLEMSQDSIAIAYSKDF
jgi:long-chain fatty acid transport protein